MHIVCIQRQYVTLPREKQQLVITNQELFLEFARRLVAMGSRQGTSIQVTAGAPHERLLAQGSWTPPRCCTT
jgi:Fe2+ transport system protein FeoA